jgi:hypothetical protein
VFKPSEIFDHFAQLIDVIRWKGLFPTVLVLQTDGGPDLDEARHSETGPGIDVRLIEFRSIGGTARRSKRICWQHCRKVHERFEFAARTCISIVARAKIC